MTSYYYCIDPVLRQAEENSNAVGLIPVSETLWTGYNIFITVALIVTLPFLTRMMMKPESEVVPVDPALLKEEACKVIFDRAAERFRKAGHKLPDGMMEIVIGGRDIGEALVNNHDVPLISATGSVPMGRAVAQKVAGRLGRSLLELGGNNAMVVTPSADLEMAVRAILFGAVGTSGQRCTSLRRLIVHEDVYDKLVPALQKAYGVIRLGNPLENGTLNGPLIDKASFDAFEAALKQAQAEGGKILTGGVRATDGVPAGGYYVKPALVEMSSQASVVKAETFAPILYVMKYKTIDDAIALQNDVPQGLSSCIFTLNVREAETFLSATAGRVKVVLIEVTGGRVARVSKKGNEARDG